MIKNSKQSVAIPPGSTIGILGSGQLGRMMTMSAKQMGYRVHVLSPSHDSPTGQVADLEIQAPFDDLPAVEAFARHVDVVTIESENIPPATFDTAAALVPSFPGREALVICQNRQLEKEFLADIQIPTGKFRIVKSLEQLSLACQELMPAVLKTTTGGYDGKGQVVIRAVDQIETAWRQLNAEEAILEEYIDYEYEFSIVAARNPSGHVTAYPSIRNDHRDGILDVSVSPSGLPDEVNFVATERVYKIMERLDSVGVMTVEFFYRDGEVLVNEIAPRPHNSGHLTIEGHMTSQFEQHIRAVCGLVAGSTRQIKPVAMANLLGDAWSDGEPKWQAGLSLPNTKLHLYGKGMPRPGRKMGHLTSIADTPEQARDHALAARTLLTMGPNLTIDRSQQTARSKLLARSSC